MPSSHAVSPTDAIRLLQFLGLGTLLFGLITALDPQYIFVATVPLITIGCLVVCLPYTTRFHRVMGTDFDKGAKKKKKNNGESRQAKRREAKSAGKA